MSTLEVGEVEIGLVAWLNQHALHDDNRVLKTAPSGGERLAPFVCCYEAEGISGWSAITSREKSQRLELAEEWRTGGTSDWRNRRQFLNDGNNIMEGPSDAFVLASSDEQTVPGERAHLSPVGVTAVIAEIHRQVHRRVRGTERVGQYWSLPGST